VSGPGLVLSLPSVELTDLPVIRVIDTRRLPRAIRMPSARRSKVSWHVSRRVAQPSCRQSRAYVTELSLQKLLRPTPPFHSPSFHCPPAPPSPFSATSSHSHWINIPSPHPFTAPRPIPSKYTGFSEVRTPWGYTGGRSATSMRRGVRAWNSAGQGGSAASTGDGGGGSSLTGWRSRERTQRRRKAQGKSNTEKMGGSSSVTSERLWYCQNRRGSWVGGKSEKTGATELSE
jgi:hypothetical protein